MVASDVETELISVISRLNDIETSLNNNRNITNSINIISESMTDRINNLEESINIHNTMESSILDNSPIQIINSILNQDLVNSALNGMEQTMEYSISYMNQIMNINDSLDQIENVLYNNSSMDKYEKMVRILNKNTSEVDNTDSCCICMDSNNSKQLYKCNGCSFISHTICIVQAINHAGLKCPQCKRVYEE